MHFTSKSQLSLQTTFKTKYLKSKNSTEKGKPMILHGDYIYTVERTTTPFDVRIGIVMVNLL